MVSWTLAALSAHLIRLFAWAALAMAALETLLAGFCLDMRGVECLVCNGRPKALLDEVMGLAPHGKASRACN